MIGATITPAGMPASTSCAHRFEPARRRRRARLHDARELAVERGDRQRDLRPDALGHARQDVDVAHDQVPIW